MGYRANIEKVVWRIMDGEAVLVHADTSAYYGLNASATCVWEALVAAALTREDMSRRLSARYGGEADTLLGDVEALVATLASESLIVEVPASDGGAADASPASNVRRDQSRYERPTLTRFGELEKLVLSGE